MIVCHCHGVTDREIRASVQHGASTCADVADACGASAGCGGCHALVAEIVAGERRRLAVVPWPLALNISQITDEVHIHNLPTK